jgi:hypothetical protein
MGHAYNTENQPRRGLKLSSSMHIQTIPKDGITTSLKTGFGESIKPKLDIRDL